MSGKCRFKNHTLVGNWYEDRFDLVENRCHPSLARTGKYSETPIKMEMPADFDPYLSTHNSTYKTHAREVNLPNYSMVHAGNIRALDAKRRAAGIKLESHDENRDAREWATTAHSAYGGRDAENGVDRMAYARFNQGMDPNVSAGTRKAEKSGVPTKTDTASGERLRVGDHRDPKDHTFVQRSWTYNRDLTNTFVAPRPTPKPVEGLSLNIGEKPAEKRTSFARRRAPGTLHEGMGIWADC